MAWQLLANLVAHELAQRMQGLILLSCGLSLSSDCISFSFSPKFLGQFVPLLDQKILFNKVHSDVTRNLLLHNPQVYYLIFRILLGKWQQLPELVSVHVFCVSKLLENILFSCFVSILQFLLLLGCIDLAVDSELFVEVGDVVCFVEGLLVLEGHVSWIAVPVALLRILDCSV